MGTRREPFLSSDPAECPIRDVLSEISGKWSILIFGALIERPRRFGELRREVPDVSQRMLTQTLRNLQRSGLVDRRVFDTVPPSVEYSLTEMGKSLRQPLDALRDWSEAHHADVRAARAAFDARRRDTTTVDK